MKRRTRYLLFLVATLLTAFGRDACSQQVTAGTARALSRVMLVTPNIEYPFEARARHMTGYGLFDIWFRTETGMVTRVDVLRSTGFKLLDDAAIKGLSRWRAKPGKFS